MIILPAFGTDTGLRYVVREPKIKSEKPPVIFMLHGYGSNEQDIFSLAPEMPDRFLIISVRAPLTIGQDGYAWYSISQSHGKTISDSAQAEQSRQLIIRFIAEMQAKYHFDEKNIYLCGFSQGAIMSYSVGFTEPQKIKGIAILSGKILDQTKPMVKMSNALKGLKIFIGHGRQDNVIPVEAARESHSYLLSLGLKPIYQEYKEGHNISGIEIADLVAWVNTP
jgi:phospholipase/carboxylesterase